MDRIALVTGATSGLGREVAERLGRDGWRVLVHGRNEARAAQVLDGIRAAGGQAQFYRADLSSMAEVRRLAHAIAGDHPRLPLLINNAGIGFGAPGAPRRVSADGIEMHLAVNYLAPVILTRELLPNLEAAAPARIVNVASIGQADIDFDDIQMERHYSGQEAYRRSKLALIMFTFDLARELEGRDVTVSALHPATFMDTGMVREMEVTPMNSVGEGADAVMNLAVSGGTRDISGEFFNGLTPARARPQAYDAQARERLRAITREIVEAG